MITPEITTRLAWTLIQFLWQGSAIAALYGTARVYCLSAARPAVRYLLGCAVLGAMLAAPIATFLRAGGADPRPVVQDTVPHARLAYTTSIPQASLAPAPTPQPSAPALIVLLWIIGATALAARLAGGWMLAEGLCSRFTRPISHHWNERFAALSTRLRVPRQARLLVSGLADTPMVIGWLRPVVLVPASVLAGFPPDHLEALLLHELAHIRRHDFLVNVLQSAVECLLFYHPAVWWISSHIRQERELCCDDAALAAGSDALTYARALAGLESGRSNTPALAMASGGGGFLARRIRRVLGVTAAPTGRAPGQALSGAMALLLVCRLYGQLAPPMPTLTFDIASLKLSKPDSHLGIEFLPGEHLLVRNATLRFLIKIAYDLNDSQILGGPAWVNAKRFDLDAKPEAAPPATAGARERVRERLRALLAERFQLTLRPESKDLDLFGLVVGRNGSKLKPSKPGAAHQFNVGKGRLSAVNVTMDEFAAFLGEGQTGRPVTDSTGLTGSYDFELDWSPDSGLTPPDPTVPVAPITDGRPSIFTAVQQQLGLKLEARKSAAACVVVDRAQLPSSN